MVNLIGFTVLLIGRSNGEGVRADARRRAEGVRGDVLFEVSSR